MLVRIMPEIINLLIKIMRVDTDNDADRGYEVLRVQPTGPAMARNCEYRKKPAMNIPHTKAAVVEAVPEFAGKNAAAARKTV